MTKYKCKHCGYGTFSQFDIKNHRCSGSTRTESSVANQGFSTTSFSPDYSVESTCRGSSSSSDSFSGGGGDFGGGGASGDY